MVADVPNLAPAGLGPHRGATLFALPNDPNPRVEQCRGKHCIRGRPRQPSIVQASARDVNVSLMLGDDRPLAPATDHPLRPASGSLDMP
jgi:hypothetical protein